MLGGMWDTMDTGRRSWMENWARGVDRHSDKELDADHDYIRVDGKMPRCPRCNNRPQAWLDRHHRCGIVRCCASSCTVVTADENLEPVSSDSLRIAWIRTFPKYTNEAEA